MSFTFNTKQTITLLKQLVEIPSPSGYTKEIMDFMENILKELQVTYIRTNKGALIATIKGEDDTKHRLLTAHTDTLGAMVKEVKVKWKIKTIHGRWISIGMQWKESTARFIQQVVKKSEELF